MNIDNTAPFEQGKLSEAASAFKEALSYTPRHAALNLNLVQIISKLYKENGDTGLLTLADDTLQSIKHIPQQHNQFKRLKHLEKLVNELRMEQDISTGTQHD